MGRVAGLVLAVFLVAGCGAAATASPTATLPAAVSPGASSPLAPTPAPTPAASPPASLIGTWTRLVSCKAALAAFTKAGFTDQVGQWVVANFVPDGASVPPGNECENAGPAGKHSHSFGADWSFASLDETGQQVDNGDYALVDSTTLAFPSHAEDFGYSGQILVGFTGSGNSMTFSVKIPADCQDACRVAYGWALSAFYAPGPFQRTGP